MARGPLKRNQRSQDSRTGRQPRFSAEAQKAIRRIARQRFSPWLSWDDRHAYEHAASCGIYVIAHLRRVPRGPANPLSSRVIYIGETRRKFSVRWNEFGRSASGGVGHAGGITYYKKFRRLNEDLHVAPFPVVGLDGRDLKILVKLYEYKLLCEFLLVHGQLPVCNTLARS